MNQYRIRRRDTGIGKPSIFSGLAPSGQLDLVGLFPSDFMHLTALNVTDILSSLLRATLDCGRGDNITTWDWAVLTGDQWAAHGALMESFKCHLSSSVDRPPRNPAKKINSGYKAREWLTYVFGMLPGLLHGVLPERYWVNFCKLVWGVRIISQRSITNEELRSAHLALVNFCIGFETLYVQRKASWIHFVRQCIHNLIHLAPETWCAGPQSLHSQWTMERTIGNLGKEIKQPSNPYKNLSERGLRRAQVNAVTSMMAVENAPVNLPPGATDYGDGYILLGPTERGKKLMTLLEADAFITFAHSLDPNWSTRGARISCCRRGRLRLPTRQIARTKWKELDKSEDAPLRISRMVKIVDDKIINGHVVPKISIGEVAYFFDATINGQDYGLAMVSVLAKIYELFPSRASKQSSPFSPSLNQRTHIFYLKILDWMSLILTLLSLLLEKKIWTNYSCSMSSDSISTTPGLSPRSSSPTAELDPGVAEMKRNLTHEVFIGSLMDPLSRGTAYKLGSTSRRSLSKKDKKRARQDEDAASEFQAFIQLMQTDPDTAESYFVGITNIRHDIADIKNMVAQFSVTMQAAIADIKVLASGPAGLPPVPQYSPSSPVPSTAIQLNLFWFKIQWKSSPLSRKKTSTMSDGDEGTTGINKHYLFICNENSVPANGYLIEEILQVVRGGLITLHSLGKLGTSFTEKTGIDAKVWMVNLVEGMFPIVGLCDGHWKALFIIQMVQGQWFSKYENSLAKKAGPSLITPAIKLEDALASSQPPLVPASACPTQPPSPARASKRPRLETANDENTVRNNAYFQARPQPPSKAALTSRNPFSNMNFNFMAPAVHSTLPAVPAMVSPTAPVTNLPNTAVAPPVTPAQAQPNHLSTPPPTIQALVITSMTPVTIPIAAAALPVTPSGDNIPIDPALHAMSMVLPPQIPATTTTPPPPPVTPAVIPQPQGSQALSLTPIPVPNIPFTPASVAQPLGIAGPAQRKPGRPHKDPAAAAGSTTKFRPPKNPTTGRSLCSTAWAKANPRLGADDFAMYWDGLSCEQQEVWNAQMAQQAAAIEDNVNPCIWFCMLRLRTHWTLNDEYLTIATFVTLDLAEGLLIPLGCTTLRIPIDHVLDQFDSTLGTPSTLTLLEFVAGLSLLLLSGRFATKKEHLWLILRLSHAIHQVKLRVLNYTDDVAFQLIHY
ncbi:hypothetical protein EST38_g9763 [Candolleomyces aberdarensis]|uniref:Uncharacterized protein n=1 Tax=Candolleomyces aberdarensis TaxID=2316362 RepID=A0A4Q2DAT8_9AGAR|nr:hypothetical protein EST38_g9763 [Candolleomyces aberdarensis]